MDRQAVELPVAMVLLYQGLLVDHPIENHLHPRRGRYRHCHLADWVPQQIFASHEHQAQRSLLLALILLPERARDAARALQRAARGVVVRALPGACAATTALSASGFDSTNGFIFRGFVEGRGRSAARRRSLAAALASADDAPTVLYESPKRVRSLVAALDARGIRRQFILELRICV